MINNVCWPCLDCFMTCLSWSDMIWSFYIFVHTIRARGVLFYLCQSLCSVFIVTEFIPLWIPKMYANVGNECQSLYIYHYTDLAKLFYSTDCNHSLAKVLSQLSSDIRFNVVCECNEVGFDKEKVIFCFCSFLQLTILVITFMEIKISNMLI